MRRGELLGSAWLRKASAAQQLFERALAGWRWQMQAALVPALLADPKSSSQLRVGWQERWCPAESQGGEEQRGALSCSRGRGWATGCLARKPPERSREANQHAPNIRFRKSHMSITFHCFTSFYKHRR